MNHLTIPIRAGMFGVLLLVGTGFAVLPTQAIAQNSLYSSSTEGLPDAPLEPTKPVPQKTSFAFKSAEAFLAGGTSFDMVTTAMSLHHPTTAYRSDGSYLTHYYVIEQGWAGVFGPRDAWTAVAANVLLNAGIDRYSRRLYGRGGRWRAVGYGLIVLKGTFNTMAALGNIRSDGRIDNEVRLATGYKGSIRWAP